MPTTTPRSALPAAVLWDMDGTLIDTEPFWMSAEIELARAWDAPWTHEDAAAMIGSSMDVCAAALQARGVRLPDEEIRDFLNARVAAGVQERVPWQPGAAALLEVLHEAGVPQALVTSSYRVLGEPFARRVGLFDAVVCGDDVTNTKPDPEPYQRAAGLLGVDVAACVAFEDSRSGVASAYASGARTIGVEVVQSLAPRPGLSRVETLEDVTLETIARVAAGEVVDLLPAA
ncbi:HAD family hydrolase [Cellulomonas alba]|uniref:HAD family phosphatase n=1 Tax=Cellulomonas alba TaxID=3053467 RepID=A0ABT7SK35_9CELL|nr:HAD family phosphatase [Cellulomonas alba]MDM7856384.1 HAD family phosphatase [Cellulomonas alba]